MDNKKKCITLTMNQKGRQASSYSKQANLGAHAFNYKRFILL